MIFIKFLHFFIIYLLKCLYKIFQNMILNFTFFLALLSNPSDLS